MRYTIDAKDSLSLQDAGMSLQIITATFTPPPPNSKELDVRSLLFRCY